MIKPVRIKSIRIKRGRKLKDKPITDWLFSLLRWPSVETTEWFCVRAAVWWVFLLLPRLHLFTSNPAFAGLARAGAEGQWQVAMGSALAVQIAAVCVGNVWMRAGVLFAFGTLWAFVAGLLWASSPHLWGIPLSTGIGVYGALSLDCFAVAIHLVRLWYINYLAHKEFVLLHSRDWHSAPIGPQN